MAKQSAGLLVFKLENKKIQVLLVHPGGPFWAKKDAGAWSIPKGEFIQDEEPLEAAKREFKEETGWDAPKGEYLELGTVKLASGKIIYAWAAEGRFDPAKLASNDFELEWPPKSGQIQKFPEIDRAAWFSTALAYKKLNKGQNPLLRRLEEYTQVKYPVLSHRYQTLPNQNSLF